ncbi:hypothetical protein Tco_0439835, partial [Tanacetum coccineum]
MAAESLTCPAKPRKNNIPCANRKKTKAWRSNDEKDVSRGGARGGTVG